MTRRTVPFGYGIHDGRYVIDAEEAETVRMIFAMYNDGASYAKIAAHMTETDIPYHGHHEGLNIKALMRIKLQKRYAPERFTFDVLKAEYGIYAVRGPRGVPNSLSESLKR
mgnify:CR=1 FL=1